MQPYFLQYLIIPEKNQERNRFHKGNTKQVQKCFSNTL